MSRPYTVGPGCATFYVILIIVYGIFGLVISPNAPSPGTYFCLAFGGIFVLALIISSIKNKIAEVKYQRQQNNQAQSSYSKAKTTATNNSKVKNIPAVTSPEQCYNQLICALPSGGANILQALRKGKKVVSMLSSSDDMCMQFFIQHPYRETLQLIHEYNPKAARNLSVKFVKLSHK